MVPRTSNKPRSPSRFDTVRIGRWKSLSWSCNTSPSRPRWLLHLCSVPSSSLCCSHNCHICTDCSSLWIPHQTRRLPLPLQTILQLVKHFFFFTSAGNRLDGDITHCRLLGRTGRPVSDIPPLTTTTPWKSGQKRKLAESWCNSACR